ncbi:unnamed protein product [Peronospora farinosa]|uniref:Uncharacterized protein n=1 Tax=Peronospora farinosa TaxID=134698 RepID=A0AAV0TZZ9_9STRA|nr:unnamed protein product [Peronospora farinosa]CAI5728555.1 unnamed protein product [Peronospora farinosa]
MNAKKGDHVADPEPFRNLLAFWMLGFINNIGYVIMIAGAQEISAGGVGLVYFFDIFPALIVKLSGPYWFQLVSYRQRVAFSGLQSGMMEASFLAMSSFYTSPVKTFTSENL